MSTLAIKYEPLARDVRFTEDTMNIRVADGREIIVPLAWFPRLLEATAEQRSHWELIGNGIGIHFPDIDEDISVENLF